LESPVRRIGRYETLLTEGARIRRPCAKPARDHIDDDLTDILFLRRIVVRAGMVSRSRESPASLPHAERLEELRGIFDVLARIEHRLDGSKPMAMKIMIDLHAADIDEPRAPFRAASKRRMAAGDSLEKMMDLRCSSHKD